MCGVPVIPETRVQKKVGGTNDHRGVSTDARFDLHLLMTYQSEGYSCFRVEHGVDVS